MTNVGGAKYGPKRGSKGGEKPMRPLTKMSGAPKQALGNIPGSKKGMFPKIGKKKVGK